MLGSTVRSTAVFTSMSSATSGVEMRGKPRPMVPCVSPATRVMAMTAAVVDAPKSDSSIMTVPAPIPASSHRRHGEGRLDDHATAA